MRAIAGLLLVALLLGCQATEPGTQLEQAPDVPDVDVGSDIEDLDAQLEELDNLEEELDLADLDEIEQDLAQI